MTDAELYSRTPEAAEARLIKRARWTYHIKNSAAYQNVQAVRQSGMDLSAALPSPPSTPRHEEARSKRHWESKCRVFRHKLQDWNEFIMSMPELAAVAEKSKVERVIQEIVNGGKTFV